MHYRSIPPLAAYIERVGAEELNFRRFMVKDWRGNYYTQRSLIIINADRSITCSNADYAPSAEEAAAIQAALQAVQWPQSVAAPVAKLADLMPLIEEPNPILYRFYDNTGQIVMLQQRVNLPDGRKFFRPWSLWTDGTWRAMEPDGALPFWRPYPLQNKPRIMIHEGAKAAAWVNDLILNPSSVHPWKEMLEDYEHWGMIGGALSPHRANYEELKRANPVEVIYVCDNDVQGKDALPTISRLWRRKLKAIYFDDRWPQSWDMADPLPEKFWDADALYCGPTLEELVFSATWATEIVPTGPKGGKPVTVVRQDFAEEWLHCTKPEVYAHKDFPHVVKNEKEFNNQIRPFSDADDTARILKKSRINKTGSLQYLPAMTPGYKAGREDGGYINTHTPSRIKPVQGDLAPWEEFLTHLVPNANERDELKRWCATLIARPDIRMQYGLLLITNAQGLGKGTLGEKVLLPLVGKHNTSVASEAQVVDSAFNSWVAHKRLAIIHEIYAGHSAKAYNLLKTIITDDHITVNKKFQEPYIIDNWIHVLACSNEIQALKISMDDRRWFVPKVTEEKRPLAYWQQFNWWLERGGLGHVRWWASEWLKTNKPVVRGAEAPMTTQKRVVAEEGYSQGQNLVAQYLRVAAEKCQGRKVMLLDVDLQALIKDYVHEGRPTDRLERTSTIRKVAQATGWHVSKYNARIEAFGTLYQRATIITNDPEVAVMEPLRVASAITGVERLNVADTARQWFNRL